MKSLLAIVFASVFAVTAVAADGSADAKVGEQLYKATCFACHDSGAAGAPKLGNKGDWEPLIASGMDAMMDVAINGKGAMPPRGASQATDEELFAAVKYMVAAVDPDAAAGAGSAADSADAEDSADEDAADSEEDTDAAEADTEDTADSEDEAQSEDADEAEGEAADDSADAKVGEQLYKTTCFACHDSGAAGAPKFGNAGDWEPLIASGMDAMMDVAINGKGAMPPRGGSQASDEELLAAVKYMVAAVDGDGAGASAAADADDSASSDDSAEAQDSDDSEQAAADEESGPPDLKAGAAAYGQTCAACHGAEGVSSVPSQPHLSAQVPEYLLKQLQEFKSGARQDPIMQPFASMLSDSDMRNISWWLAEQEEATGLAADAELAELGESIYRGGLPDRRIASCAACHGPAGAGIPSQYPHLAGQFAEYTAKQLHGFATGERANSDVMHEVVRYMTDHEIAAVSDFIAGLRQVGSGK